MNYFSEVSIFGIERKTPYCIGKTVRRTTITIVVSATIVITSPLATIGAAPAGASASPPLSRLLTVADLPASWTVTSKPHKATAISLPGCLAGAQKAGNDAGWVTAKFIRNFFFVHNFFLISEGLTVGDIGIAAWSRGLRAIKNCHTITYQVQGKTVHGTIAPLSVPQVGDRSAAYALKLSVQGVHLQSDAVYFVAGRYFGYLSYGDVGTPDPTSLVAFADEAVNKIEGKPAHSPQTNPL